MDTSDTEITYRKYVFKNGSQLEIFNIVKTKISSAYDHLIDTDGYEYFIPEGTWDYLIMHNEPPKAEFVRNPLRHD